MTNTKTEDHEATLGQCRALAIAGCDIVRVTVPDASAAKCIKYLKSEGIEMPIVADIHFDYRLALESAAALKLLVKKLCLMWYHLELRPRL
jgi:(E)-4-hydroxy-3-methylbut-2-enyl-diphosphate synthase